MSDGAMSPSSVPRVKSGSAAGGLQQAVLDELVLDGAVTAHLAGWRVAAVEAHEGIGQLVIELAGDVLIINVLGHTVVDVSRVTVSPEAHIPMYSDRAP